MLKKTPVKFDFLKSHPSGKPIGVPRQGCFNNNKGRPEKKKKKKGYWKLM